MFCTLLASQSLSSNPLVFALLTICTKIGVSSPSKASKPLANAAAVIWTRPSSDAYIFKSCRNVECSRNRPRPCVPDWSCLEVPWPPGYMHRNILPSSSACIRPIQFNHLDSFFDAWRFVYLPAGVNSPPHFKIKTSDGSLASPSMRFKREKYIIIIMDLYKLMLYRNRDSEEFGQSECTVLGERSLDNFCSE